MLRIDCQLPDGSPCGYLEIPKKLFISTTFGELKRILKDIGTFYHYNHQFDFRTDTDVVGDEEMIVEADRVIARRIFSVVIPPPSPFCEAVLTEACTICLEDFQEEALKIIGCGHVFHAHCLLEWKAHQRSCPLCRRDF